MNASSRTAHATRASQPAARFAASLPRLFARRAAQRTADRAAVRSAVPASMAARPADAPTGESRRGPGWFDSSWDLRQGLEVREGLPADARLHEWIEVCLRG
jgi:hypothetical protein